MNSTPKDIRTFQNTIYDYYRSHKRSFPWRDTKNPYHILVSEIMLQQTQTDRVIKKYREFIAAFPDFAALARANLSEILRVWQGMGYNRRAIALQKIAQRVINDHEGRLPRDVLSLKTLPGIGEATASSIAAFAFNEPTIFIETNIRTVFIHFFFEARTDVDDTEILPLLEKSLDRRHPAEWYSALMDYGAMLKSVHGNAGTRSRHYRKQSPFRGSDRQLRGAIIRMLLKNPGFSAAQLADDLTEQPDRVKCLLSSLHSEGFIYSDKGRYYLR